MKLYMYLISQKKKKTVVNAYEYSRSKNAGILIHGMSDRGSSSIRPGFFLHVLKCICPLHYHLHFVTSPTDDNL